MLAPDAPRVREGAPLVPVPFGLAVRAAILDADGRMLVVRRAAASRVGAGDWEWPGGKAELGERLDEALVREVSEECGLDVEPTHLVGAYELELPGLRAVSVCLAARVRGGTLALSVEHDDARWVGAVELGAIPVASGARDLMAAFVGAAARAVATCPPSATPVQSGRRPR